MWRVIVCNRGRERQRWEFPWIPFHSVGMDDLLPSVDANAVDDRGDDFRDHVRTRETILEFGADFVELLVFEGLEVTARYCLEEKLLSTAVGAERSLVRVVWAVVIFSLMNNVGALRDIPPDIAKILCHPRDKVIETSTISVLEVFNPAVGW